MSAETPAPRVKLNDLPLELKRHIAELCAEQDARLAAWSAALVRQSQDNALVAGGAVQLRHKYDHSLGALFQVSKEWSEIVAPLHFETVRFGHEGVTPVFKFQVATRRPQHFQVLDLTGSNAAVVDALFPLLPLFTNISKVVIDAPAAVAVLGEDGIDEAAEDDEVKAYVRSLIQSISAALFPQLLVFRVDAIRLFPSTLPIPPNHPINDLGALFAPDGKPHPTLRIVEIYHPEQTLTQAREETLIAHFAAVSPRLVVVTSPASPAPSRALLAPEAATPAHAAAQADAVHRNVAFLAGWNARLDALEREGADDEVVRRERGELAELLGRVELTRLARGL
ncbi:hypothetical protein JCM10450v2_008199 [Rhodotorula kratochvilovae]